MDLGISEKRALILGSSQGLGFGIARYLAQEGAKVMLLGRNEERLKKSAEALQAEGTKLQNYVVADLSDSDSAARIHEATMDALGGIDILVNNSGGPQPGSVANIDAADWLTQFETMILRIMEITSLCLPGMRAEGWGRVINIVSSGVIQPIPNLGMSNTLRASLLGWAKTLSNEVAGEGITVNSVVPGRIHTSRVDELDAKAAEHQGKTPEEIAAASRATIPTGRYGRVEEFAAVVTFLASEPASYVNGSMIRVDGGFIRSL